MISEQIYMQEVLKKAWQYQLRTYPNPAVGALLLYNNEILALEAHQKAGTSHAEVLAFISAYENMSQQKINFDRFDANKAHAFLYDLPKEFFSECILFVSLEPCSHVGKTPSCASLVAKLKPKKVIIGTLDPIQGHDGGIKRLEEQGIDVKVGVCEKEALELIEPFLIWQERAFVLFKIAQTSNGKIGGGYLSSKESLMHVHQLRAVCNKMLIGGNTVRVDRPTLDCRFSLNTLGGDMAPNIMIYSKADNFDRAIPLFSVEGREVEVVSRLDFKKPSFILVEGGEGMLKALQHDIDWLLQYQTPILSCHNSNYEIDLKVKFMFQYKISVDLLLWSKIIKK
ncbi:MAG: Diaminohydroxyphosphoribosylaminopyrimidine deaminase (EC / 5-amino-6-(5-phosphoribosylamino)uracil reductase (EC [uncultured Sulfurovum sp.]|uniref:Diaminohydroxyphosphoribosylaminopyrimidine deaminase uracil reductase (EC)) n=1 Tax=uncultured Sulfurovum sp. TaxID=269237 RepID=A0A6S6SJ78_9BACT|nr:MAG: Diaminohydroxyphosphoribosylaminopyrimidine deaminase (EC / 5-amino-6-(5-phosphoribosylamino)uracil reductase (EC [uncultured Sulfurovum sp.]